MNDSMQLLDDFAWAVWRMRDAQRLFEKTGSVSDGKAMREAEQEVDDLIAEHTMPTPPDDTPEVK